MFWMALLKKKNKTKSLTREHGVLFFKCLPRCLCIFSLGQVVWGDKEKHDFGVHGDPRGIDDVSTVSKTGIIKFPILGGSNLMLKCMVFFSRISTS